MKRGSLFTVYAESWICSVLSPTTCMNRTPIGQKSKGGLSKGLLVHSKQLWIIRSQCQIPALTRAAIPSQIWNFAMSGPPSTSASSHQQIVGPADADEHDLANAQFITFHSARWDFSHKQVVQQQSSSATPASRRSRQSPSPGEATNKRQRTEDKQHKGPAGV